MEIYSRLFNVAWYNSISPLFFFIELISAIDFEHKAVIRHTTIDKCAVCAVLHTKSHYGSIEKKTVKFLHIRMH